MTAMMTKVNGNNLILVEEEEDEGKTLCLIDKRQKITQV